MLTIRMDDEIYDAAGAAHALDRCPGYHRETGVSCHDNCQACHLGPCDDYEEAARGANAVLAYLHLLPGCRLVRGVAASLGSDSWSVRLHEHADRFTDERGAAVRVWSVVTKDRSQERLHVSLYRALADADAVYESLVADLDEEGLGVEHVNVRSGH